MDVVIISPVSPFDPRDGHRLAIFSDLCAALDNGLQVGVIAFTYGRESESADCACARKLIAARPGGFAIRLLRGLGTDVPPSAERLYGKRAQGEVRAALTKWKPRVVIVDDSLVAGYIPLVRNLLPQAKVVLRSHNVMHDVRREQLGRTRGPLRPFIKYDCEKFLRFERSAVEACDAHWAITSADARRMNELYGKPAACLTVSLALEKYQPLWREQGRTNSFVHVGTLDFRRRLDLNEFLKRSWPKVLAADSNATLTLAGTVHGAAIQASNVNYAGHVAKDTDVYRLARYAFNFQSTTGGLKLKTLTSLAAGRTLVSTPAGVEGLALQPGQHFWPMDRFVSSPDLKDMLRDQGTAQPLADAGRQYVIAHHSRAAVARQFRNLFESF